LVTVFGGSGSIGRQVVKLLSQRGDQVRVAVRDPQAALFLKSMGDVGQITPVQANIRNMGSVHSAVAGVDLVVNLVGILNESGPQRFPIVQTQGAQNVAAAAAAAGVQSFVHLSAIGASQTSPSAYARSKAGGEEAVLTAFPSASILRPSVVFGPHDQFFNRFAALAKFPIPLPVFGCGIPKMTMEGLKIYGDGGTRFQPVYVGDVAQAIITCLEKAETNGKTYELGGPQIYSFCELMELILRHTRRWRPLIPIPFGIASAMGFFMGILPKPILTLDQVRQLAIDNVVNDASLTFGDLGISPRAAEVILPEMLEFYRRGGPYAKIQPL
jgi:NADH dehydrogenase